MTHPYIMVTSENVLTGEETIVADEVRSLREASRYLTDPLVCTAPGVFAESEPRWRPTHDGKLTQRRSLVIDTATVTPASLSRIARYFANSASRQAAKLAELPMDKLWGPAIVLERSPPDPNAEATQPVEEKPKRKRRTRSEVATMTGDSRWNEPEPVSFGSGDLFS